ncbi:uncharacterized protein LOC119236487 isoform X1 [Talpa occidentalis]|uniref:uncharacterized protein LOC119236487 isoform X1 n=1 Tax=Talpa occidentalis TaxID=50954 RepID=UPI00188F00D8|nr:uncharacterized protein LOC119236487 isoform X1 [Talpa occidentalis]XP_054547482.1 uncharacterized protein LOC119236487 isoform X1 [Talpa occidentalis]XP_054547483.1 uncharacterized protein LOC119236487 isoform X1 [Talpa occidentalis]
MTSIFKQDLQKPSSSRPNRDLWVLLLSLLGPRSTNENIARVSVSSTLPACSIYNSDDSRNTIDGDHGFPTWHTCTFPSAGLRYQPYQTNLSVYDFSVLGAGTSATNVPKDYRFLLQDALIYNRSNHFIPPLEPVTRWYSAGWITPAYIVNTSNGSRAYPDLFHLLAATSPVRFRRPGHSVNASTVGACVGPPYTLLVEGPRLLTITYHHHVFHVNCTDCILTNCITSVGSLSKATFVILHQPPYVMLPVSLQQPWYDDIGLYTLQLVGQGLRRSKRFVAALILGITALIAIISSVAVSTTTLVQQVHTASHVNDLSRNITHALIIQDHIDNKFEARLNVLEESLLHIGNQIQHIKTHLTTKCHSDYK